MAEIKNLRRFQQLLRKLERAAEREHNGNVIVGYDAEYALYVHENIEMKWKGKKRRGKHESGQKRKGKYWDPKGRGQAKFLEQPKREFEGEMLEIVQKAASRGVGLVKALLLAGNRLQRESQKLVPVDTGNLKGSAFVEEE